MKDIEINTDDFLALLKSSLDSLPTSDLELSDFGNGLGITIANLVGSVEDLERDVIDGIAHGFELVRLREANTVN